MLKCGVVALDPLSPVSFLIFRAPELLWPMGQRLVKLTDWTIPGEFTGVRLIRMIATYTAVVTDDIPLKACAFTNQPGKRMTCPFNS